jgi:hypothetical protein
VRSERSETVKKMARGEVQHAITNYLFRFSFLIPHSTHSQAVSSVYTGWVCGVPFSSLFGSSYVQDNVTGTVPPASPIRLQYEYVGICSHLQHDAGPDRRNLSFSVVITDAWPSGVERGARLARHGMSSSRVLATISASWPLTGLQCRYDAGKCMTG